MPLADRLADRRNTDRKCLFAKLLAEMPPDDAAAAESWLFGDLASHPLQWLVEELANEGWSVGEGTLRRHRQQACACR